MRLLPFAPTKINYHKKRMIKHNLIYPRINGFIERAVNFLKRIIDYRGLRKLISHLI